jgi:hypothetical protein
VKHPVPKEEAVIPVESQSMLRAFTEGLNAIFGRKARRPVRWSGLALLTYYLNPFHLVPPAQSSFFDEINETADILREAFRGGLFRRGDE